MWLKYFYILLVFASLNMFPWIVYGKIKFNKCTEFNKRQEYALDCHIFCIAIFFQMRKKTVECEWNDVIILTC